ncbi:MAG: hypothetical protein J7K36_09045 [Archaeoglobaceae archaeon]|nr:hypothetical protein [Archaeoglobaceae archaeon]
MNNIINFRKTVSPLTADSDTKTAYLDGAITEIILHFPPGCNALVGVKVFLNTRQILPQEGVIALDNATQSFKLFVPCKKGDIIRVDWENHDDTYSHTVSVIVNVEGHYEKS